MNEIYLDLIDLPQEKAHFFKNHRQLIWRTDSSHKNYRALVFCVPNLDDLWTARFTPHIPEYYNVLTNESLLLMLNTVLVPKGFRALLYDDEKTLGWEPLSYHEQVELLRAKKSVYPNEPSRVTRD
jgi:hypothetical protein